MRKTLVCTGSQHKFGIQIAIIRIHKTEFRPHFPFQPLLFTTNQSISYLGYNFELQNFQTRAKRTIFQLDSKIILLNKKKYQEHNLKHVKNIVFS